MINPFEAVWDMMKGNMDNEPKAPLHVGEVMNLWTLLTIFEDAHAVYIAALNTTTDDELIHAIKNAEKESKQDVKELKKFLEREGVPLPPTAEGKPKSDPNEIPLGVKLTDSEIANAISAKIAACITFCGKGMAESIRNDVAMLLLKHQTRLMIYGESFKSLMRKRGWIKVPPYYYPPGMPKQ